MTHSASTNGRLDELRASFDASFAQPPTDAGAAEVDLIGILVGDAPCAVRLHDVVGLHTDRQVAPLPGPLTELRGLTGLRGLVVPVYDLGALLGYPPQAAPRWMAMVAGAPPIAVAFTALQGQLRVAPDAISTDGDSELVRAPDGVRPIVNLQHIRTRIQHRVHQRAGREQ